MQLLGVSPWRFLLYLGSAYGLLTVVFALWRGRWRERTVAVAVLVSSVAEYAYAWLALGIAPRLGPLPGWRAPPVWYEPATDVLILAVCVACALRSDRYWTIWASSFALLSVALHLVWPFTTGLTWWAHAWAMDIWFGLMTTALLAGAWSAHRERARAAAASKSQP
ncbi:MAG: hypothetical protein ABI655_14395 [Phenylobacterium sp.]